MITTEGSHIVAALGFFFFITKKQLSSTAQNNKHSLNTISNTYHYLTDTRTNLLIDRGYTGHEHINKFGIINMNGRIYDPQLARFYSPDPFIQAPDMAQNFNRYAYCMNNPLIYSDPSGEYFIIDDLIVMAVGGTINLAINAVQGNVNSWGEGFGYFFTGAAAAEVTIYAGPVAGGYC